MRRRARKRGACTAEAERDGDDVKLTVTHSGEGALTTFTVYVDPEEADRLREDLEGCVEK